MCSWIGRLNIVKMYYTTQSDILNNIGLGNMGNQNERFGQPNTIPIKIPVAFFFLFRKGKILPKSHMESQVTLNS